MPFFSNLNWEELIQRIDKKGGWFACFYNPFKNYWYKIFLGHVAFTYLILYISLPGFISAKKNKIFIVLITFIIIAVYLVLAYINAYSNYADAVKDGHRSVIPDHWYIIANLTKTTLFTLPTIVGMAVTIKFLKYSWLKQREVEQLAREKAMAELQLLKSQIHPHFLFNTLNNIYFFTISASRKAPEMIKKLSDMLRYILDECDHQTVPLEKELKMINDYMDLEKIRYGEQMEMVIDIKGNSLNKMVSPLLLIPFIENSFKHGASKMLTHPYVKLSISIEDNLLIFLLKNNKPDMVSPTPKNGNIGLKNVQKRLQLLYPGTHELNLVNEPGNFTVFLKIKLYEATPVTTSEKIQSEMYELA